MPACGKPTACHGMHRVLNFDTELNEITLRFPWQGTHKSCFNSRVLGGEGGKVIDPVAFLKCKAIELVVSS